MDLLDGEPHRLPVPGGRLPAGQPGLAARARRLLRLLRRRCREEAAACCQAARRRGSPWRSMLYDPPNFLVLDEPTNHLDMATKEMLITPPSPPIEGTMLFVSHDRHFLAALSNRVLELTPGGIHQYGGGYTEYVARTGTGGAGAAWVMGDRRGASPLSEPHPTRPQCGLDRRHVVLVLEVVPTPALRRSAWRTWSEPWCAAPSGGLQRPFGLCRGRVREGALPHWRESKCLVATRWGVIHGLDERCSLASGRLAVASIADRGGGGP
jgi:energy-coupling factor transporter ATP-binding protein EcfA2